MKKSIKAWAEYCNCENLILSQYTFPTKKEAKENSFCKVTKVVITFNINPTKRTRKVRRK